MDEYLEEETECIKQALDSICQKWDHEVCSCSKQSSVTTDGIARSIGRLETSRQRRTDIPERLESRSSQA
jgi:hypothetical protein